MINKIKDGINLWTLRGKTNKNMRIVRPADINKIVDEANADISANTSAISANTSAISTNTSAITALGGEWIYAEQSITDVQLTNDLGAGIELLPTLAAGQYYEYRIIVEKTAAAFSNMGTVDFIGVATYVNYAGTYIQASNLLGMSSNVGPAIIASSDDRINGVSGTVAFSNFTQTTEAIILGSLSGTNVNSVDAGNVFLVKKWYRVRTVGTEL